MRGKILSLICGCLTLMLPSLSRADATYIYQGINFTVFADSPWTTSDNISGALTLASSLPPNLGVDTDETSLVKSFSFSDGVRTFTKTSVTTFFYFSFGTDASGDITSWYFQFNDSQGLAVTSQNDNSFIGDSVGKAGVKYAQSPGAGQWSPVPEPTPVVLLATAALGFFGPIRRKLLR